jgi:hypothetical protein
MLILIRVAQTSRKGGTYETRIVTEPGAIGVAVHMSVRPLLRWRARDMTTALKPIPYPEGCAAPTVCAASTILDAARSSDRSAMGKEDSR